MAFQFNPPPGWPKPPEGWQPPPGWQPDPSWPPAPPGWQFWIDDNAPTPPPGQTQPWAPPSKAEQPPSGKVLQWFRTRPTWAKVVIIILALGLLPWELIVAGLVVTTLGVLGLVRGPLPRFRITSRPLAVGALLLGLAALGSGSALAVAVAKSPAPAPTSTKPSGTAIRQVPATVATTVAQPTTASTVSVTTRAPAPVRKPPTTHAPRPATTHAPATSPPRTTIQRSLCGAPSNPYGYNFCGRGGYVTNPPQDICSYFNCIPNFWNGVGYMEECHDATYSMSGGRRGACSYHGGELRPVYSGP